MPDNETRATSKLESIVQKAGNKVELTSEGIHILSVLTDIIRELEHKIDGIIKRTSEEDARTRDCCRQLLSPERIHTETILQQRVSILWTGAIWLLSTIGVSVIASILYFAGLTGK